MQRLFMHNLLQLGILLAGVAAIAVLLHMVEKASSRVVAHHFGWRGVLVTGWLGVPLHELAHLVAAKLFGHRIVGVAFFDPDPSTGTLGYVRHAHSKRTAWQLVGNAVIGIAPLIAGALAIAALLAWMVGPDELGRLLTPPQRTLRDVADLRLVARDAVAMAWRLLQAIWKHRTWWLPLQIYMGICVASHCTPSDVDMEGSWAGGLVVGAAALAGIALAAALGVRAAAPTGVLVLMTVIAVMTSAFQGLWAAIAATSQQLETR
ncbi:MAG TPA: hypothetical protein VLC93_13520 [Myxococcota bacterium]|nr:hypothetical protein [Myxococcota bacterium]